MDCALSLQDLEWILRNQEIPQAWLAELRRVLDRRLRDLRMETASRFRCGMRVRFRARTRWGFRGRIVVKEGLYLGFARTRARVDCGGVVWAVHPSALEIVEGEPAGE
jgi:hypothetical protein